MRERNLLYLFLALNVALAGAFVVYLFLANSGQPQIVATAFPNPLTNNPATNASAPAPAAATPQIKTNAPVAISTAEEKSAPAPVANTNRAELKPVFTGKKFTWEQVESEEYSKYIDSLRAVGCPEEKVRYIILADINELCAKKRIKAAIAHDTQWWHAEPELMLVNALQEKGRELEEQRRRLIIKLLGPEALENEKGESLLWSSVQLTGPVLGSLSPEVHSQVQDICAKSMERHQSTFWARANGSQPLTPVEMAKMREQTRVDLKQVLNAQEMEEFLLRYSYNAQQLRAELRDLEPTSEEFRKIFRALDPIDHQMQLEFGSKEAMSEKQKLRYEHQREDIIKEGLGQQRFEVYLLTRDPLYRQAQMFAVQYGAPPKAVMPIYKMTKANESRRQQIMEDPTLSPQQKSEEINSIYQKQQQSIQQIAAEAKGQN